VIDRTVVTDAGLITGAVAPVSLDPSSGNGTLLILDSTISNSIGARDGGVFVTAASDQSVMPPVYAAPSTATIADSTISGNVGESQAGGVELDDAQLSLRDDTIADNTGNEAGGLLVAVDASATVTDSVLATNKTEEPTGATQDCQTHTGTVTDGGHNLIGVAAPGTEHDCGFVNGNDGDLTGSASAPLDPGLGTLALNGGTTPTQALLAGSPAIGAGDPSGCEAAPVSDLDQRGHSRRATTRDACDIGAYDTGGA